MKFWQNKNVQLYAGGFLVGLSLIFVIKKLVKKDYSKYKWFNDTRTRNYYDKLHPKFKPRVAEFLSKVEDAGMSTYITSGYRTFQEQVILHNQNPSNAKPGYSHHNFGLAIDVNIMKNGVIILRKNDSCEKWKNSGVPELAKQSNILWYCNHRGYHDPVHFHIEPKGITTTILRNRVNEGKVDKNGYVLL